MKHERSIMLVMVLLLLLGWTVHERLTGNTWLLGMVLVFGGLSVVALIINNLSA